MNHHKDYYSNCSALIDDYGLRHLIHFSPRKNLESVFNEGLRPSFENIDNNSVICCTLESPMFNLYDADKRRNGEMVIFVISLKVVFDKKCRFYWKSPLNSKMAEDARGDLSKSWHFKKVLECGNRSHEVRVIGSIEPNYIDQVVLDADVSDDELSDLRKTYPTIKFLPFQWKREDCGVWSEK